MLARTIALCRMAVQYAEIGTEVEVGKLDGHQKRIPAHGRAVPVLRPGQDPPAVLTSAATGLQHPIAVSGTTVPNRLRWKISGSPA